jgi:putative two-component system response regulator
VYDALTSKRLYKEAYTHEKSKEIIIGLRGTHFDPDVVDAFLARENDFKRICEELREQETELPEPAEPQKIAAQQG